MATIISIIYLSFILLPPSQTAVVDLRVASVIITISVDMFSFFVHAKFYRRGYLVTRLQEQGESVPLCESAK